MYAFVGCCTSPDRNGRGTGIGVYQWDPATAAWDQVRVLAGVTPSFLAVEALAALTRRMPPLSKMTDDSPEAS